LSSALCKLIDIGGSEYGAPQAHDIAAMHTTLLGHSPLVLMGPEFMESFYYSVLPREDLICGVVAYVDGNPAGFIVATVDPEGFMSTATSRHRLQIVWLMLKSVVRSPSRILAVKEAYKIQSNVEAQKYGLDMGEILSFGVLPQYRSRRFIAETSLKIGTILMESAVQQLASRGTTRIRAIIDKDNLEAKLFYRSQGWRVGLTDVQGWSVPTMEFLYDFIPIEAKETG